MKNKRRFQKKIYYEGEDYIEVNNFIEYYGLILAFIIFSPIFAFILWFIELRKIYFSRKVIWEEI